MVVNYDLPFMFERDATKGADRNIDVETYIHRIGRTGRFGRKGVSVNFVYDDQSWRQMRSLEELIGKKMITIKTGDIEVMEEASFFHVILFSKVLMPTLTGYEEELEVAAVTHKQLGFILIYPWRNEICNE